MTKLEATTHVCLIAMGVVSTGVLLERRFAPRLISVRAMANSELIGKHLDATGLNWSSARTNAVLFISTKCHFCEESMPFYRQLADLCRPQADLVMSVLSAEPPGEVKRHLFENGVAIEHIYQIPLSPASLLHGTPTLLLVDSAGTIRQAFTGKLTSGEEKKVLSLVSAAKS